MFMCAYVWSFVRVYARACVKMSVMAANTLTEKDLVRKEKLNSDCVRMK